MSEVVTELNPNFLPGSGYDKLDRVDVIEQKDGVIKYFGVIAFGEGEDSHEVKIPLRDMAKIWGFEVDPIELYKDNPVAYDLHKQLIQKVAHNSKLEAELADLKTRVDQLSSGKNPIINKNTLTRSNRAKNWLLGLGLVTIIGVGAYGVHELNEDQAAVSLPKVEKPAIVNTPANVMTVGDRNLLVTDTRADKYTNILLERENRLTLQDRNIGKEILKATNIQTKLIADTKKVVVQTRNEARETNYQLEKRTNLPVVVNNADSNTGGFNYPYDWSASIYGSANAEAQLQKLGKKAQAAGHKVVWSKGGLINGNQVEILNVDGQNSTSYITKILTQFR